MFIVFILDLICWWGISAGAFEAPVELFILFPEAQTDEQCFCFNTELNTTHMLPKFRIIPTFLSIPKEDFMLSAQFAAVIWICTSANWNIQTNFDLEYFTLHISSNKHSASKNDFLITCCLLSQHVIPFIIKHIKWSYIYVLKRKELTTLLCLSDIKYALK